MEKKLYKKEEGKVLCGVCGGIAEYFNIDVVLVRVLWAVGSLFVGAGLLAYIVAAIIMPANPNGELK